MHLQPLRETLHEIAVSLALPADRFRLLGRTSIDWYWKKSQSGSWTLESAA